MTFGMVGDLLRLVDALAAFLRLGLMRRPFGVPRESFSLNRGSLRASITAAQVRSRRSHPHRDKRGSALAATPRHRKLREAVNHCHPRNRIAIE